MSGIDPRLVAQSSGLTIGELFRQAAAAHPDRIALQDRQRALTYAEFATRAGRLACALAGQGVRPGDRVAVLSENRREFVELQMACAMLGAILACQNWRQADPELSHCLRLVTPNLLFVSERYAGTLARLGLDIPAVTFGAGYEKLLDAAPDAPLAGPDDAEAGVVILYTSGTTGMPKGALISHRAVIARASVSRIDGGTIPGRAFIAWAPLFHMVSTDPVFATLMSGGTVIVMDGLVVPELVEWVGQADINHLTLMPGMIDRVIDEMKRSGTKPRSIVSCGCMADLVPRHQIAEITTLLDAPFRNSFGSTETGSPPAGGHSVPVGELPERLSKRQNSLCLIRLVDEDDRDVPDGEPGELLIRGPTLFSGYWGAPEVNARDFRGGWFHMGDVFVRNEDSTLDFVDRRKYLIKSGGENIYPAEIENALRLSPRIHDAVVVRRPDPRWGEVPVAFVVPLDATLTAAEVIAACEGRVARYKLPRDVVFVADADLPRSATGKIKRHELEQRLRTNEQQTAA
ncbi:MAG: class I adenylate-forming enzyme family protein [Acetobacteraceae bacterium]|nr:class I adenylate-forming enzyme family protein [Acetobacteraceae bacterium]